MLFAALLFGPACTDAATADSVPCASETSQLPESCACSTPTLALGGGTTEFVPAVDGEPATIVHGPQGGWHILGSAWLENYERIVTIRYTITVAEAGAIVSTNDYRVQTVQVDACTGYYPGMYGYLDVAALSSGEADTPPEILAGVELLLAMEAIDSEGRTARDELLVVGALDLIDQ